MVFASVLSPEALGYFCVFYVIVLFSSSIVRHRMPVIFFALALFALLHSFLDLLKNEKMYIYRKTSKQNTTILQSKMPQFFKIICIIHLFLVILQPIY